MKKTTYEYEQKIEDVEEIAGTDIKINPDYYIHNAIVKAQAALTSPDVNAGFLQFRVLVENIEILCRAGKMIPDDYQKQLEDFKKQNEYAAEENREIKAVRLANKKMEILLHKVFAAKVSTAAMKI